MIEALFLEADYQKKVGKSGIIRIIFSDLGDRENLQVAAKIHLKCLDGLPLDENEEKFLLKHRSLKWPD